MSDSDRFLSRWSRRKREAAEQAATPDTPRAPAAAPRTQEQAQHEIAPAASASELPAEREAKTGEAQPGFDISNLPSLDSIGPGTDIKPFLRAGVPGSLSNAALRRAWTADPAIRDFVGLAENSWDFTAPDSMPGFGPLLPTDNVKELLAQVFGGANRTAQDRAQELLQTETFGKPDASRTENAPVAGQASEEDPAPDTDPAAAVDEQAEEPVARNDLVQRTRDDSARQQEQRDRMEPVPANRRRHGGALPT